MAASRNAVGRLADREFTRLYVNTCIRWRCQRSRRWMPPAALESTCGLRHGLRTKHRKKIREWRSGVAVAGCGRAAARASPRGKSERTQRNSQNAQWIALHKGIATGRQINRTQGLRVRASRHAGAAARVRSGARCRQRATRAICRSPCGTDASTRGTSGNASSSGAPVAIDRG